MLAVGCLCGFKADSRNCVKEALRTRISRERVGIELEKMLKGDWVSPNRSQSRYRYLLLLQVPIHTFQ